MRVTELLEPLTMRMKPILEERLRCSNGQSERVDLMMCSERLRHRRSRRNPWINLWNNEDNQHLLSRRS